MLDDKFSTLLGVSIIPAVIERFPEQEQQNMLDKFYRSNVFEILSRKDTSLWHLSSATLTQMFLDELKTGNFEIPQEQS